MNKIELLKRLVFIADSLKFYNELNFKDVRIGINTYIDKSEYLQYSFKVLEIPFNLFTFKSEYGEVVKPPSEINVYFGILIDIKIIYFLTYILKEIYNDEINIYISYFKNPRTKQSEIICGSYITNNKNISRPINVYEILGLYIEDINIKEFSSIFPNTNISDDEYCNDPNYIDRENNYDDNDFLREKTYGKYSGSYAQDVEGLSDDFIDDVLDGEPSAYWNID